MNDGNWCSLHLAAIRVERNRQQIILYGIHEMTSRYVPRIAAPLSTTVR